MLYTHACIRHMNIHTNTPSVTELSRGLFVRTSLCRDWDGFIAGAVASVAGDCMPGAKGHR